SKARLSTADGVVGRRRDGSSFVTGGAVNGCARLELAAAPGEILVGERAVAAARGAFEFAEPATVKARGKPDKQLLGRATFTAVEAHRFLASVLEIRRFKGLPEARGAGGVE